MIRKSHYYIIIPALLIFGGLLIYPVRGKIFSASVPSLEEISNGAYAQILPADEVQNVLEQISAIEQTIAPKVTLSATPILPLEGDNFTVKAASFRYDETKASYQWFVNNKLLDEKSGFGLDEISLTAGKAGTVYKIKVIVKAIDDDGKQQTLSNELGVSVAGLDISWTAETYTPLNYEGRPLMTSGSKVAVSAIAQIGAIANKQLLYTWFVDDRKIGTSVGYGRQELEFSSDNPVGKTHRVRVEVADLYGTKAGKSITIKIIKPEVLIYKSGNGKTDMIPRESQALRELIVKRGEEINLAAIPYFFSVKKPEELVYQWRFNGELLSGAPTNPNLITLKVPENAAQGEYDLSLTASNPQKTLQFASSGLKIFIR